MDATPAASRPGAPTELRGGAVPGFPNPIHLTACIHDSYPAKLVITLPKHSTHSKLPPEGVKRSVETFDGCRPIAGGVFPKMFMATSNDLLTAEPDLGRWAERLEDARRDYHLPFDLKPRAEDFAQRVLSLMFPHFADSVAEAGREIHHELEEVSNCLLGALHPLVSERAEAVAAEMMAALPDIHEMLLEDAQAISAGDPAAVSADEVILAYPGFLAVAVYRVAHVLYRADVPIVPRLLTEYAHSLTGIDIHPGAQIGRAFAIDHGTGVVIGETTIIGERVRLFQGVTLGALCVAKDLARKKRHPTIEDDVVIYANATILGGETVIGARSIIGGNVWLTRSVPPDSVATHRSDVRLKSDTPDFIEYHI